MINLARIVMVNWYTFGAKNIDLRGSAAIIGPNGAGKSSLLDAIQVVLTGNNRNLFSLNASSNVTAGRGRRGRSEDARSVLHYCLGKIHNVVLRPECITYLALVFERERDGRCWTVGLGLSAREEDGNEETLGAFIAPDQSLRAADFLDEIEGGGRVPIEYDELTTRLKRVKGFENFGHRPTNFTRRVLMELRGRGGYAEPDRFLRTIRNALRFREMNSANDFIRNFILEEDRLDVEGLRSSVAIWRGFQEKIDELERQKIKVSEAIAEHRELIEKLEDEKRFRWIARKAERDRLEGHLAHVRKTAADKKEAADAVQRALERGRQAIQGIVEEIAEIKRSLATNDKELAIKAFQLELPAAKKSVEDGDARRGDLLSALASGATIHARLVMLYGNDEYRASRTALEALATRLKGEARVDPKDVDVVARQTIDPLSRYADLLQQTREGLLANLGRLRGDLRELQDQLRGLIAGNAMIRRPTQNLIERLKGEGIAARPVAEMVEVTDEAWREAAETMLGPAREALIVDPREARRATAVMRAGRRDFVGCQIVNTTKTKEVSAVPEPDSLAAVIVTDDPHARSFINRRLNSVVRVDTEEELLRVDRGVTKDCVSAAGGSIEVRRPAANHPLGRDARERNRPLLEQAIADAERDFERNDRQAKAYAELITDIRHYLAAVSGPVGLQELDREVRDATERQLRIEDNIRKLEGERPIEIRERLAELERDLDGHRKDEQEDTRRQRVALYEHASADSKMAEAVEQFDTAEVAFLAVDEISEDERATAMLDYRALKTELGNAAAIRNAANEAASSAARRAQVLTGSAPRLAHAFAWEFHIPGFDEHRSPAVQLAWLDEQLAIIEGNHLTRYKDQAATARAAVEEALRSDLLVKLYTRIELARTQIRDLNAMLRHRIFHKERYEFDVRPDPAYSDIVQVAKRVYDNDADVMTLFASGAQLDADLARGVERIHKMLDGGGDVSEISDYRNYLRFELITRRIEDDQIASQYSQRQQSGSGGEKQVPFYIAISSAVAATCHHRETVRDHMGLGLVLFDEAFNALDGGNVSSCLSLMGEFNLQVVACAPTEKLASFMEHMDTIVTINRDRTHCQIDVEYPTKFGRQRFREANPANVSLDMFREIYARDNVSDAAE